MIAKRTSVRVWTRARPATTEPPRRAARTAGRPIGCSARGRVRRCNMSRVTVKHVRQMSENVSKNMRRVGLLRDDQVLVLIEAERMNGIPYRLHTATDGTGGYGDTGLVPGGNGFLGHTAREALRVLEVVNAGLSRSTTASRCGRCRR